MRMKNLAVLIALPLTLVACGGDSGSSSGGGSSVYTPGNSIEAQFIDAPVKGLKYTIGTTNSFTGDNGILSCKSGEEVTFSVGDKVIGSVTCGEKIYISDLVLPGNIESPNIAASLIQSLSKTVNGVLDLSQFNEAEYSISGIDLTNEVNADFAIASAVTAVGNGLIHVNVADATEHVLANLPDLSSDSTMATLAVATTNGTWLTLNKISGDGNCWDKFSAKLEVKETVQASGKKNYRFSILKAIGHDTDANLTTYEDFEQADCNSESNEYYCDLQPVHPRYMTNRAISISSYLETPETFSKVDTKVCISNEDYYWGTFTSCDSGYSSYSANNDYVGIWAEGFNLGFTVTNSSYSLKFNESWSGLIPNLASISGNTIGFTKSSANCSYSATGSL